MIGKYVAGVVTNAIKSQVKKTVVGTTALAVTSTVVGACCLAALTTEHSKRKEAERRAAKAEAELAAVKAGKQ